MKRTDSTNSDSIVRWLLVEGPRQSSPSELLHSYSLKLRAAGVQVDRSSIGAPILHPVAQSSYVFWDFENGPEQRWFNYSPEMLETLRESPIYPIYQHGKASSIRLDRPQERARYPVGEDLWAEGYFQYDAIPLKFSDGSFKTLTLATRSREGFSAADSALVQASLPALSLVFEGFVARNTAVTLMETYVGKRAGLRVLDGEISRGHGSHIDAVIWISDLRGFTALAQSLSEDALLDLLNDHFGKLTDAIEGQSGEVLKFIGDAVLAIFAHEDDVSDAVARAESAALEVMETNGSAYNYSFGIGLHTGSVFYGNIGGGSRLDFTVIGSSVNITSRIEGLCAKIGQPLLASAEFVQKSSLPWESVGQHKLKGAEQPVEIFSLEKNDK